MCLSWPWKVVFGYVLYVIIFNAIKISVSSSHEYFFLNHFDTFHGNLLSKISNCTSYCPHHFWNNCYISKGAVSSNAKGSVQVQCRWSVFFYTPVWKTGRIMPWQCPSVRLSVRLSVRPSVRPRFPDFSSTCFEISIWNLVYAFSRWHDMSSLSCITIGSLWPSLQPKVGQTYFLQSWPHKSR